MPRDGLYAIACALLVALCILAAVPWLEMGVNDDWSYVWTAKGLAETGHFVYSGWSEPMLGVQALWAAALIRQFGFSFTLTRLSTLPFACGCAALLFLLGRRAGLNRPYAVFGSLMAALSPLFVPLAASFMTDAPSWFFWLACVYCAERAAAAKPAGRAGAWLAAAVAAGVAGGSVRQVVWMVPVVTLAAAAWIRRRDKLFAGMAAFGCCVSLGGSLLCLRWFLAQPHAQMLTGSEAPQGAMFFTYLTASVVWLTVGGSLFLLPLLVLHMQSWRGDRRAPADLRIALGAVAALASLHWYFRQDLLVGNTVTVFGVLNGVGEALGSRPVVVTSFVRGLLKALLAAGGVATLATAAGIVRRVKLRRLLNPDAGDAAAEPIRVVMLLAPSCLLYAAILLYRGILFDRYLLPLIPLVAIPLLYRQQSRIRKAPAAPAWIALAALSLYAVGATHDYFAASRARGQAAAALMAAGIARSNITVGLESDAWAELEHSGHIAAAVVPSEGTGWHPERPKPASTAAPTGWFWRKAPSIGAAYFVTYSRFSDLRDVAPPAAYRTWIPPATRFVYAQGR